MATPGSKPSEKLQLTLVPPREEPPSQFRFSLVFEEGKALLRLKKGLLFDIVHFLDLELEIPRVTFPIDVSEGAQTFRGTECLVNALELNIYEDKLNQLIKSNFDYSGIDLEDISLQFLDGGFLVSGVSRKEEGTVRFTFKGAIEVEDEGWVRVYLHDLRLYGNFGSPAPLLFLKILGPLAIYSFAPDELSSFSFNVFYLFLGIVFPLGGWKAPLSEGLSIESFSFSRERLTVRLRREEGLTPISLRITEDVSVIRLRESLEFLKDCEALLAKERGITAAKAYESKFADNPFNPLIIERLLQIYSSIPEEHGRGIELGESFIQKGKEYPSILSGIGSLLCGKGDFGQAASYYGRLLQISKEENSFHDTVFSSLIMADLLASKDPAAAASLCESVLELDFGNLDAIRALTGLYEKQGLWDKAVGAYNQLIEAIEDIPSRLFFLLKVGEIYEEWLSELDMAIGCYERALKLSGDSIPAWEGVARVHLKKGAPLKAIAVYEELLKRAREVHDLERLAAIHIDIGQVWESSNDMDQAILHYSQALESFPDYEPAMEKLAEIWSKQRAWQKVISLYEQMFNSAQKRGDVWKATGVLYTIGKLWQDKIKDYDKAMERYQALLEIEPGYVPALESLSQIYGDSQNHESLLQVYSQLAQYITEPRRLAFTFYEMGKILQTKLLRNDEAIAHFRKAVEADPTFAQPWQSLDEIYRESENWSDLAKIYMDRAVALKDLDRSIAFIMEAAQIYEEKLHDIKGEENCYLEAVKALPLYVPALDSLARIYRDQERWEELLEIYDRQSRAIKDKKRLVPIFINMGLIWKDALGHPEMAVAAFEHALTLDPLCIPAIHAMQEVFKVTNDWTSLYEVLEKETGVVKDKGRLIALYQEMASLALTTLSRRDLGKEAYIRALDIEPGRQDLLMALAKIYSQEGEWEELVQVYSTLAETIQDPRISAEYYLAAGDMWEKRLAGPDLAILSYKKALKKNPASFKVLQALGRLYLQEKKWEGLIEVYSHLEKLSTKPEKNMEFLCLMGRIWWGRLKQGKKAVECYRKALEMDNSNIPALSGLSTVYREEKAWDPLFSTYEILGPLLPDPAIGAQLLVQTARSWKKLGKNERAVSCFLMALERDPAHPQALNGLMELFKEQGKWEEWVEYAERLLGTIEKPENALNIHFEVARVWKEELKDLQRADEKYRGILLLDPGNAQACAALEEIYTVQERWEDLVYILTLNTRNLQGTREGAELYARIGSIYLSKLNMTREAREACETALSSDPAYRPPFRMLESIHTSSSDWAELCSLYERRARALGSGDEAANLYVSRGEIFDKNLDMKEEALSSYKMAHSLAPGDMRIMAMMVDLCRVQKWTGELIKALVTRAGMEEKKKAALTYCEAAGILSHRPGQEGSQEKLLKLAIGADPECSESYQGLEELYERQGRWKELVGLLRDEAVKKEGSEKRKLLFRIARTLEERLDELSVAEEAYSEALTIEHDDFASLQGLERIAERRGDHRRLAEVREKEIEVLGNDPRAMLILMRLGALYEEDLNELEKAVGAYEHAIELKPGHLPALTALSRLYRSLQNWPAFVNTCVRMIPALDSKEEKSSMSYEMAVAMKEKLGNSNDAMRAFRSAIDWNRNNSSAWVGLMDIYISEKNFGGVVAVFEEMIDTLPTREIILSSGFRAVDVMKDDGEKDRALHVLRRLISWDPHCIQAWESQINLLFAEERWEDVRKTCEEMIGKFYPEGGPVEHQDKVLFAIVMLGRSEEKLGSRVTAERRYREAVGIDVNHLPAWESLGPLLYSQSRWADARVAYEKIVSLSHKAKPLAPVCMRLGEILEKLGKDEEALFPYRQAVELDPALDTAGEALIRLYKKYELWEDLVSLHKIQLNAASGAERIFSLHLEIAALSKDRLKVWDDAIMNYLQALEVKPDFTSAHERLYELYQLKGDWESAVLSLKNLLKNESNPGRISELMFSLGELYDTKLSQPAVALDIYRKAGDTAPANLKVWESMALLAERIEKWEEAAIALEQLAARSAPERKKEPAFKLGTIYREKIGKVDLAIRSYELALKCDPKQKETRLALARTYGASPKHLQRSAEEFLWLINQEPFDIKYYEGLRLAYDNMGQRGDGEVIASTIFFLDPKAGGAKESEPRPIKKPLKEEMGRDPIHPWENSPIRFVIAPLVPYLYRFSPHGEDLPAVKRARNVGASYLPSVKSLWDEVSSLIAPGPVVCSLTDGTLPDGCWFSSSSSVCWNGPLLKSLAVSEARFVFGRALELVKSGYPALRDVKPDLWPVLIQSISAMLKGEKLPDNQLRWRQRRFLKRVKKHIAGLDDKTRHVIAANIQRVRPQDWLQGIVYRANRVGLLASGGIAPAASALLKLKGLSLLTQRMASQGALGVFAEPSITQPIKAELVEMLLFSVSRPYLAIRRSLS